MQKELFNRSINAMRKLFFTLLIIGWSLPCFATTHQTTGLSAAGSSIIIQPGADTKIIIIQNNGSNSVRISLDGGISYNTNGGHGTNPTPTTGYLLTAGQQLTISTGPFTGIMPDTTLHKPIVAIMVTGTTTLDIITDGVSDIYPTN